MVSLKKKLQTDSVCSKAVCMNTAYFCLGNRQNLFFGKFTSAKGICC